MTSFVVDYFELPTADTAKSSAFFREPFGWGEKAYGPGSSELLEAGVLGGLNGVPEGRSAGSVLGIRTAHVGSAQAAVHNAGGAHSSLQPHLPA